MNHRDTETQRNQFGIVAKSTFWPIVLSVFVFSESDAESGSNHLVGHG